MTTPRRNPPAPCPCPEGHEAVEFVAANGQHYMQCAQGVTCWTGPERRTRKAAVAAWNGAMKGVKRV